MAKRKFTVELAGTEQVIEELPTRKQELWRQKVFDSDLQELFVTFQRFGTLDTTSLQLNKNMVDLIQPIFQKGPQRIAELIHDYCPKLSLDYLLDECYEPELINAFIIVVRLAFPFESLMEQFKKLNLNGPSTQPTLKNSPFQNGESATKIEVKTDS
jgi:hypothetical protein